MSTNLDHAVDAVDEPAPAAMMTTPLPTGMVPVPRGVTRRVLGHLCCTTDGLTIFRWRVEPKRLWVSVLSVLSEGSWFVTLLRFKRGCAPNRTKETEKTVGLHMSNSISALRPSRAVMLKVAAIWTKFSAQARSSGVSSRSAVA